MSEAVKLEIVIVDYYKIIKWCKIILTRELGSLFRRDFATLEKKSLKTWNITRVPLVTLGSWIFAWTYFRGWIFFSFCVDIFSLMIQTQIFRVDKFSRILVNIDKIFFQGNKKSDSFIKTYTWNKAWRSNILIKITTNEIISKKKVSAFCLQNILQ